MHAQRLEEPSASISRVPWALPSNAKFNDTQYALSLTTRYATSNIAREREREREKEREREGERERER